MTTRVCPKCRRGLAEAAFYGPTGYCRECQKAYVAGRYVPRPPTPRTCVVCGAVFIVKGKGSICSAECRRTRDAERQRKNSRKRPPGRDKRARGYRPPTNATRNKLRRYKTRKRGNGVFDITPKDLFRLYSGPCAYCGGQGGTIDHVVPISRGGRHAIGNLVSACQSCNAAKGARLLVEWRKLA